MSRVVTTSDGSSTVSGDRFSGELYHSSRGAVGEAQHVYIRFLRDGCRVLEVGFGTGLNALLSLHSGLRIDYTAIELYPLEVQTVRLLSYYDASLEALHNAKWGERVAINDMFSIKKIQTDIVQIGSLAIGERYDVVFFDAFAPDTVPEQWSEGVFAAIFDLMNAGGVLTTYSSKGDVKRALRAVGFDVKRQVGALGKHNMICATRR